LRGRRRPSRYKINYLLHLDDHRQCALRGLRRAKMLVHEIVRFAKQPHSVNAQALSRICERCEKIDVSLKSLDHDLESLDQMLRDTRDMVSNAGYYA
jgi:hypothetical protein